MAVETSTPASLAYRTYEALLTLRYFLFRGLPAPLEKPFEIVNFCRVARVMGQIQTLTNRSIYFQCPTPCNIVEC
jgi:hypothetical protein